MTIGDPLSELDEPRREMLKRIIPVADIHPMDLLQKVHGKDAIITNLAICKPFGEWNVVGIMNPADAPFELNFSLEADFHIDTRNGLTYAIYDFWQNKFLGVYGDTVPLTVAPMDTTVLRITPLSGHPQVISTSRHITQGGYDLNDLQWDEAKNTLSGNSKMIADEIYRLSVFVPESYELTDIDRASQKTYAAADRILTVELTPEYNENLVWQLNFNVLQK